MTPTQIREAVFKALTEGSGWPPSLPEFIALGVGEMDYEAAYFRCLNKVPEGRIEQWVYENAYFNIRTAPDSSARKMHERYMREAMQMERQGKLVLNEDRLKELPEHSVKNLNDIKREEYEAKHGKALNPRIAKILEGKK